MKKEDLTKVFAYAKLLWNNFYMPEDDGSKIMQIQVWYDFLSQYDLETIFASMRELSKQSDFCNIGKIAKGCQTIHNLEKYEISREEQIFNEINNAISLYDTQEKFDKLSKIAKIVVGSAGNLGAWAGMEIGTFNSVVASNIRRSIRTQLEREQQIESIGHETLEKIAYNIGVEKQLQEKQQKKLLNS